MDLEVLYKRICDKNLPPSEWAEVMFDLRMINVNRCDNLEEVIKDTCYQALMYSRRTEEGWPETLCYSTSLGGVLQILGQNAILQNSKLTYCPSQNSRQPIHLHLDNKKLMGDYVFNHIRMGVWEVNETIKDLSKYLLYVDFDFDCLPNDTVFTWNGVEWRTYYYTWVNSLSRADVLYSDSALEVLVCLTKMFADLSLQGKPAQVYLDKSIPEKYWVSNQ